MILSRIIMRSMPTGGWKMWLGPSRGHAREGRFEIHGLDPETQVPVHFLDSEHELGATIQLSGKSAGAGPVTVRLERCGTAKVRLVDSAGKPVKGQVLSTSVLVTPGVSFSARDRNPGVMVSEGADLSRLDPGHYRTIPVSDAQGQIIYPALIPGVTYRFVDPTAFRGPDGARIRKEFSLKPGENLDLGDILIEKPMSEKSLICQWSVVRHHHPCLPFAVRKGMQGSRDRPTRAMLDRKARLSEVPPDCPSC